MKIKNMIIINNLLVVKLLLLHSSIITMVFHLASSYNTTVLVQNLSPDFYTNRPVRLTRFIPPSQRSCRWEVVGYSWEVICVIVLISRLVKSKVTHTCFERWVIRMNCQAYGYDPLKYVYKWSKISFSWITPKILTFEYYAKNKTYWVVNFICV